MKLQALWIIKPNANFATDYKIGQGTDSPFITHRLTTIKNSDVIFVMDKARVVESGSHFEFMEQNGRYSTFTNNKIQVHKPSS